jgi:hypothetical protein
LVGWVGFFRGFLRRDDGVEVLVRSPRLARRAAESLNAMAAGLAVDGRAVAQESQIPRYTAARSPDSKGRTLVFATDPGRFGTGIVGAAHDPALARKIAELLNQLDPASYKRGTRGIGWW